MTYDKSMWKALATAACGRCVLVWARDEMAAKDAFRRYADALKDIGLDGKVWAAYGQVGNQLIRFENGGEVRFVSHVSHLDGKKPGTVVMDYDRD